MYIMLASCVLLGLSFAQDNCILLHTEILHFTNFTKKITNSIYGYGFIELSARAVLLNGLHQRKNVI